MKVENNWKTAPKVDKRYLFGAAQTSKSAVSRVSKPAGRPAFASSADLEIGDTAG
jgi:hypothetical protein